ncbi:ribosomal RNA-processing protein 7-domain-containing protein [Abortiporus biennis]|nr:ribosomal RNA-processing protein 7-domain-containing protein [Abortiporus biennis]
MSASLPNLIQGFTPIPLSYNLPSASSSVKKSSSCSHILYVRAHTNSKATKPKSKGKEKDGNNLPEGRTLFIVNVPPDSTEREFALFFKPWGTIERVLFEDEGRDINGGLEEGEDVMTDDEEDEGRQSSEDEDVEDEDQDQQPRKRRRLDKNQKTKETPPQVIPLPSLPARSSLHKTGSNAHVVFLDSTSLSRFISSASTLSSAKPKPWPPKTDSIESDENLSGLAYYKSLFTSLRPPLDIVKSHADTWMTLFEYNIAKEKRREQESKYRKGEAIVDEDGFTLVTRGGAYGQTIGGGVGVASKKFQVAVAKGEVGEGGREGEGGGRKRSKRKKEPKEKESFYSFQVHERKRKELVDLKTKWEEDKAKVERLKSSRKFKPY